MKMVDYLDLTEDQRARAEYIDLMEDLEADSYIVTLEDDQGETIVVSNIPSE